MNRYFKFNWGCFGLAFLITSFSIICWAPRFELKYQIIYYFGCWILSTIQLAWMEAHPSRYHFYKS
jgi:hypothetical protein